MTTYALGIDIGGTKIAAGLVSAGGPLVESVMTVRTPVDRGPDAILRATEDLARSVLAGLGAKDSGASVVVGVGVGSAGVIAVWVVRSFVMDTWTLGKRARADPSGMWPAVWHRCANARADSVAISKRPQPAQPWKPHTRS